MKKRGDWDWTLENTNKIDREKLDVFFKRHAKKTERFIEDTFDRVNIQMFCVLYRVVLSCPEQL